MLFGLQFMSHLTLYNAVHNTHAILTFSTYVGDVTADGTLLASASAWNCHHTGTIVLIARCTSCKCRPSPCCFAASFGDRRPTASTTVPGRH